MGPARPGDFQRDEKEGRLLRGLLTVVRPGRAPGNPAAEVTCADVVVAIIAERGSLVGKPVPTRETVAGETGQPFVDGFDLLASVAETGADYATVDTWLLQKVLCRRCSRAKNLKGRAGNWTRGARPSINDVADFPDGTFSPELCPDICFNLHLGG